jgi:hypothetical protein
MFERLWMRNSNNLFHQQFVTANIAFTTHPNALTKNKKTLDIHRLQERRNLLSDVRLSCSA